MPLSISATSSGELGVIAPTFMGFFRNAWRNWRFSFMRHRLCRNRVFRFNAQSYVYVIDSHFIITFLVLAITDGAIFICCLFSRNEAPAFLARFLYRLIRIYGVAIGIVRPSARFHHLPFFFAVFLGCAFLAEGLVFFAKAPGTS